MWQKVWAAAAAIVAVGTTTGQAGGRQPPPSAARTATGSPIQHIVYIIQENHSFDNVLGAWCIQKGRCDGATSGELYGGSPYPLAVAKDKIPNIGHGSGDQVTAVDGGKMDGFSRLPNCTSTNHYACYSQFEPSQIPNVISLADAFAVSDRTFEDASIPSWGSHLSAATATLDGFDTGQIPFATGKAPLAPGWGCDSGLDSAWSAPDGKPIAVPACVPDYSLDTATYPYGGAYRKTPVSHVPTIMDRLDAAGLTWHIYAGTGGMGNSNGYGWAICPTFADCLYTDQARNLVPNIQILTDAGTGALPAYSIVTPTQTNSQHNDDSMAVGDNWIGQVISKIQHGPDWSSTAIFLTWDDCGCFYDHVTPPGALGIRVPMILISPYAIAGHTDSAVASFASVLAFTEHNFGLPALTSEDGNAYDYSRSFAYAHAPSRPVKMRMTPVSSRELQQIKASPPDPSDPT